MGSKIATKTTDGEGEGHKKNVYPGQQNPKYTTATVMYLLGYLLSTYNCSYISHTKWIDYKQIQIYKRNHKLK